MYTFLSSDLNQQGGVEYGEQLVNIWKESHKTRLHGFRLSGCGGSNGGARKKQKHQKRQKKQ